MDEAFVRAYLDGQVSRRVFIRRAVATGLTVTGAIAFADALAAAPAQAATTGVNVSDYFFSPQRQRVALGDTVQWNWSGSGHRLYPPIGGLDLGMFEPFQAPPFPSGHFQNLSHPDAIFGIAGMWIYRCPDDKHGGGAVMNGRIEVPVRVSPKSAKVGSRFLIEWAVVEPPFGVFDVEVRPPGGTWVRWKNGLAKSKRKGRYAAKVRGTYQVRARFRNPTASNAASGWSPVVKFTAK